MDKFNSLLDQMKVLVNDSSADDLKTIENSLINFVENIVKPTRWQKLQDEVYQDDENTPFWQK